MLRLSSQDKGRDYSCIKGSGPSLASTVEIFTGGFSQLSDARTSASGFFDSCGLSQKIDQFLLETVSGSVLVVAGMPGVERHEMAHSDEACIGVSSAPVTAQQFSYEYQLYCH